MTSNTPEPPRARSGAASWQTWALLAAVLLLGGYFRTLNLTGWDGTSNLHPDERFIIYTAYNLRVPQSFADYLRSDCVVDGHLPAARNPDEPLDRQEPTRDSGCNTLNPRNFNWSRFFVYGTLPTTLTRVTAEALAAVQPPGEREITPEFVRNTGRTLSTLFDLGSVLMVFLIGRRLYGERVGLLGALFLALSALPIQLAHFFTVDATTGFFVLLAVYWAVRAQQGGGIGTFTALGLSIGAAMACRFTMGTLGLLAIAAVAVRLWDDRGRRTADDGRRTTDDARSVAGGRRPVVGGPSSVIGLFALLALAGALSLLTWRVLQPDAFVGTSFFDMHLEPRFLKNVQEVGGMISGETDFPPGQQWAGRIPYLFSLQNMVIWGMGLPLGIAAWLGWAAAGWQIVRRRRFVHLIPWSWIAFYFAWQGGQFVMTMRYYALLYGLLALFAAWGLARLTNAKFKMQNERRGILHFAFLTRALLLLVVLGTALWAYAFTRIYTEPHSRIQASRWIYQNIPPGSAITFEEWDDPLPLGIDGRDASWYVGVKTAPYWEDDPIKYFGYVDGNGEYQPGLLDQLDQADYLIFSSNRVYDSATRLGMRYPALTRYYHSLFSGELGFELAADIHSYPRLFGIELPSPLYAEEAFSVYDHPRVLIFKKTDAYTRENAERLITGDVAWGEVYKLPTLKVNKVPTALRLTDAQWPAYQAAGTWSALFPAGGIVNLAPWLFWLLALEALAFACFALLFRLLPGLPDRGFALAKMLGLLLVAYGAWLLASTGPNAARGVPLVAWGAGGVWLWTLLLAGAGALSAGLGRAELLAFVRRRRTALITAEALFLAAFFGFLLVRAINPDLWHPARGGEKPMDLAFLTAVLKSPAFPPYDPWFAGGFINYYYFGFVLVGALIHLTGIAPGTAYNLAVPTIFALTAVGAWGAAYNLVAPRVRQSAEEKRKRGEEENAQHVLSSSPLLPFSSSWQRLERRAIASGLAAALFAVLAGNLANALWLLPGTANPNEPGLSAECQAAASYGAQNACRGRSEWAFWDATRTVSIATGDGTINEFPFFTFLYGDLHAHMIALPLLLAALGLIVALVRNAKCKMQNGNADILHFAFCIVLLALVAGALRATNTWDYPTALGLGVLGIGLAAWSHARRDGLWRSAVGGAALGVVLLLGLSTLLFLPFTRSFATDYAGFELWSGARTPATEFLKINGLWLFLLLSAALVLLVRAERVRPTPALALGIGLVLLTAAVAALGLPALVLQVILVVAGSVMLFDLALRTAERAVPAAPRRGPRTPVDDGGAVQLTLPLDEPETATLIRGPSRAPLVSGPTLLAVLWGVCALGITALTELVVAKGDIGRMNTVFKFGMQSWLLFAVTSGVALVWLWGLTAAKKRRAEEEEKRSDDLSSSPALLFSSPPSPAAWAWRIAAVALIAAALVYPVTATPARLADRFDTTIGPTLDGEAFMRSPQATWGENGQVFNFAEDADAIAWVRANVPGTPVILEAHAEAYRWAGRFSVYTGLPTLLGWPWHMTQQRSVADGGTIVGNRQGIIRQLYDGGDPDAALNDLRLYGVEYVVVGQLERALYSPAGLAKFDAMAQSGAITTVYDAGDTRIYRVEPKENPPAIVHTTLPVVPPTLPGKSLMLTVPVDMLPVLDEFGWNALAQNQFVAVILWLLAWYGLLVLGLPIAVLVFGGRTKDQEPRTEDQEPRTKNQEPRTEGQLPEAGVDVEAAQALVVRRSSLVSRWSDGGFAWARLIGLLLLGYAVWLPVSARLWQYDRWGLVLGVLLVVALNALLLATLGRMQNANGNMQNTALAGDHFALFILHSKTGLHTIRDHLNLHRRAMLQVEALFLTTFVFMVGLRALNPDLWQPIWGGEKPFEFGFLNAMLRTPVLPPYNPFYSGGVINYYYYGFFLVSLPVKATGIAPAVAFNLIVPTLFALLLAGAFALVARLGNGWRVGLLGALLVGVVGNLSGALDASWLGRGGLPVVLETLGAGVGGFGERLGDWFIGASRVVPHTINEFPYFSFLFADLHPHMIALPITLLMIALVWQVFGELRQGSGVSGRAGEGTALPYALIALTLGALAVTNSWDFPTYGLLLGGALLGRAWRVPALGGWERAIELVRAAATGLLLGGLALLLYLPFFQNFQPPVSGLGMVSDTTRVSDYLILYGLFLAVLVPAVLGAAWRLLRTLEVGTQRREPRSASALGFVAGVPGASGALGSLRAALAALSLLVVLIAVAQPALRLLGAPAAMPDLVSAVLGLRLWLAALIAITIGVLLSRRIGGRAWFTFWLALVAWIVSLLFEFVYLRDHLQGGEWYRMNTVFKFGLQAWVLLAVAAALALPGLWRALGRIGAGVRAAYGAVLGFLLALALVYPLAGTPSRVALRFPENPGPTLDGLAFLQTAEFTPPEYAASVSEPGAPIRLQSDGEAIQWLLENVRGTPVVLQSSLEFYRAYGIRVAANTGLPTIVSPLHESEQRDGELVAQRDRDVQTIYRTTDEDEALRLLSLYRVGYVYVGPIERNAYGEAGAAKWEALTRPAQTRPEYLSQVFANEQVRIYKVSEKVWQLPTLPQADPVAQVTPRPMPEPAVPEVPAAEQPVVVDEVPAADLATLEAQVLARPEAAGPAFELAGRYRDAGRLDEAANLLSIAARANPSDVGLHHLWGDILMDAGRYDEAEAALRTAAAADPSAGNWNKLGVAMVIAGRLDVAEAAFQQAMTIEPGNAEPYLRLGQLQEERGSNDEAAANYRRYLDLAPNGPYQRDAQDGLARVSR
jgi:YYY domain-containing protein